MTPSTLPQRWQATNMSANQTPLEGEQPDKKSLIDIEALKGVCSYSLRRQLTELVENIRVAQSSMEGYLRSYNDSFRLLQERLKRKQNVESALEGGEDIGRAAKHFEGLITSGKYLRFEFTDDRIIGYSVPIFITYQKVKYDLGSYKVQVQLSGAVNIYGTVRNQGFEGYCHPHVSSSNSPCFGNVAAEVPKLIHAGNYGVLMELIYDFLSSYGNGGNPYQAIERFPIAKKTFLEKAAELPPQPAPASPRRTRRESVPDSDSGELVPAPVSGRFMQLAQRTSRTPVRDSLPNRTDTPNPGQMPVQDAIAAVTAGTPFVISARVDRDLRANGINPTSLNEYERTKMSALNNFTNLPGTYRRKLSYYVTWYNRRRDARR